jgi:hypothetical protein
MADAKRCGAACGAVPWLLQRNGGAQALGCLVFAHAQDISAARGATTLSVEIPLIVSLSCHCLAPILLGQQERLSFGAKQWEI